MFPPLSLPPWDRGKNSFPNCGWEHITSLVWISEPNPLGEISCPASLGAWVQERGTPEGGELVAVCLRLPATAVFCSGKKCQRAASRWSWAARVGCLVVLACWV